MINETIKIEKKEKMDFPPIPKDVYPVELLDITLHERPTYKTKALPAEQQIMEKVFKFQFTILEGKDGETDLRGRNLWASFVPTYLYEGKNGKNELYQIAEAFLSRTLTPEDEATLDNEVLNSWISKQIRITNDHKTSKQGGVFDIITGYLKAGKPLPSLTAEEKEKAKVKPKDDKDTNQKSNDEQIKIDDIPF
ncbi:MAG: hypothetical protein PHQ20_03655 [Candidatus Moranbacteria bacterium]|nr:hypothetical protein [Candidatus Moranbacteria bacterium]